MVDSEEPDSELTKIREEIASANAQIERILGEVEKRPKTSVPQIVGIISSIIIVPMLILLADKSFDTATDLGGLKISYGTLSTSTNQLSKDFEEYKIKVTQLTSFQESFAKNLDGLNQSTKENVKNFSELNTTVKIGNERLINLQKRLEDAESGIKNLLQFHSNPPSPNQVPENNTPNKQGKKPDGKTPQKVKRELDIEAFERKVERQEKRLQLLLNKDTAKNEEIVVNVISPGGEISSLAEKVSSYLTSKGYRGSVFQASNVPVGLYSDQGSLSGRAIATVWVDTENKSNIREILSAVKAMLPDYQILYESRDFVDPKVFEGLILTGGPNEVVITLTD